MILNLKEVVSPADAERMRVIRNQCREFMTNNTNEISKDEQAAWFAKLNRNVVQPFLFVADGDPIGYGIIKTENEWSETQAECIKKWLTGGLALDCRGHKLGRELFKCLIREAAGPCYLEVRKSNIAAVRTYEHLGFTEVSSKDGIVTMQLGFDSFVAKHSYSPDVVAVASTVSQSVPEPVAKRHIPANNTDIPRRVMVSMINYDHRQVGIERAFEGVFGKDNVTCFDYMTLAKEGGIDGTNQAFVKAALDFKPDWIFLQLQDSGIVTAQSLLYLQTQLPRTVITHWTGDARPRISDYLASICKSTHVTLVSNVGQLSSYRASGALRAEYLQIGVDWDEDVLGEPSWTPPFEVPDVVFIGMNYGDAFGVGSAERITAIRALKNAGIKIGIVGGGWPGDVPVIGVCGVKQQHHVWKRAKVCLSINNFNDIEQYYSDRQLISMASGTPVVCKYIPGLEKEFLNRHHCIWFHDNKELVDIVTELLGDVSLRAAIGTRGRAEVIAKHTWFARIMQVLPSVIEVREGLSA